MRRDDDDDDDDDDYHDTNCIWLSQDELIEHVNSIGCTLDLPPFSLSSTQAQQLVGLSIPFLLILI